MSTLTKVLIVLLSLFSIFLCGTIVTYVGNANNYKAMYDSERSQLMTVEKERASAVRRYNEQLEVIDELKKGYEDRIGLLQEEKAKLTVDYRNAERASQKYLARADSYQGILTGFEQTIGNLEVSLKSTQTELDKLRTERVDENKKFNELTATLYENVVQLQAVTADKRRLLEEKKGLEEQVENLAGGKGAVVSGTANVVTPEPGSATSVASVGKAALTGVITEVSESLVSISIGSADGVAKNMIFHVTRGDDFICDIVVTNVDTDKAAGVLELKLGQPRIGDTVSTSFK